MKINCFLSGENDGFDIYLEIHAWRWREQKSGLG
jgi:hypothetical protein